jgi:hypothetical protein
LKDPKNGLRGYVELMPDCNSANSQIFLDDFSTQESEELIVIISDNGAFHKAKFLKIPENIILIFYFRIHLSLIQ